LNYCNARAFEMILDDGDGGVGLCTYANT